ncbi:MAG TPA: mannosyltransferase family protein [Blastocatellia bacterium]|nr:mannosyltransferase family protein [Blastocatellia bacterium]
MRNHPWTNKTSSALPIPGVWLGLRLLTSLWLVSWSAVRPQTDLENAVPPWPPSSPFGDWLQRVWLMPWLRWDAWHYLNIATRGYRPDDGTAQFHPLYPLLGKVGGTLAGGNMLAGLLIVSSIGALICLTSFERLASLDLSPEAARRAVFYFAHAPAAFILFAPYPESLFLSCSIIALLMARRGRWWAAGLAGGLAALVRQQGIFLLVPLAWELWESAERDWKKLFSRWRAASGLTLVPAGLLVWLLYRAIALSDVSFDWQQPKTLIYGLMISGSATRVVKVQSFMPPWQALWTALGNLNVTNVIDLALGGSYLLLLLAGGKYLWRLRQSYFLYALTVIVVSFSYNTGAVNSYMGLPRHCLLAFPLFLPLAVWGGRRRSVHLAVMTAGLVVTLALAMFYTTRIFWVP